MCSFVSNVHHIGVWIAKIHANPDILNSQFYMIDFIPMKQTKICGWFQVTFLNQTPIFVFILNGWGGRINVFKNPQITQMTLRYYELTYVKISHKIVDSMNA